MTSVLRYALLVLVWQQASARSAAAQERVITGTVHTRGGIPIEGAHVRMPAARIETVTSAAGAFRLRLPSLVGPSLDTLRVERIGYRSRVSVLQPGDTARHLDVALTEVATRLDEVVVTATAGTQTRRAQAGVVSTVSLEDLQRDVPLATLPDALQGRVTSVDLTPSSGSSGEAQRIWLRGGTSIALTNEPLVFIDGIRADSRLQRLRPDVGGQSSSRLFDLDPADIERVEIVKGPAASAMYGAEASAGVIQIFTHRPTLGREHFRCMSTPRSAVSTRIGLRPQTSRGAAWGM